MSHELVPDHAGDATGDQADWRRRDQADWRHRDQADWKRERRGPFGRLLTRAVGPYVDRATILGILLLVVLVTLPRLRSLAIHENELDALRTLDVLGGEVFAAEGARPERLGELFADASDDAALLERRLADTRVLDDGRLLLRYGYLFELVEGPRGPGVRAWPVEQGRTGQGAFWLGADLSLCGDANREARWSGPSRPPSPAEVGDWRALEPPAAADL